MDSTAQALTRDAWSVVFLHCDQPSLLNVVLTSSLAYTLAIPHLLHSITIGRDHHQIVSFLSFILNDEATLTFRNKSTSNGAYVRRFIIDPALTDRKKTFDTERIGDWAPRLTTALCKMPNLRIFKLGKGAGHVIPSSPGFWNAVLAAQQLNSLHIEETGSRAFETLGDALTLAGNSLSQRLREVKFSMTSTFLDVVAISAGPSLPHFLKGQQANLTSLWLQGFDLGEILYKVHFPLVEELVLANYYNLTLDGLRASFPRIRLLALDFQIPLLPQGPFSEFAFPNLSTVRGTHQQLQALLESNAMAPEFLRGFRLNAYDIIDDPSALEVLKPLSHLENLSIHQGNAMASWEWWWGLGTVMANRLTFLSLFFALSPMNDGLEVVINDIPAALARLPLKYVALGFHAHANFLGDEALARDGLASFDDFLGVAWATQIHTLAYMDIWRQLPHYELRTEHESRGWIEIHRGVGQPTIRRLTKERGEKIRRAHDKWERASSFAS